MNSNILDADTKTSNITINKELTDKYKNKNLFVDKLNLIGLRSISKIETYLKKLKK